MNRVVEVIAFAVVVVFMILMLPFVPVIWLLAQSTAEKCPRCGSRWRTEIAESDSKQDLWHCRNCHLLWLVPVAQK